MTSSTGTQVEFGSDSDSMNVSVPAVRIEHSQTQTRIQKLQPYLHDQPYIDSSSDTLPMVAVAFTPIGPRGFDNPKREYNQDDSFASTKRTAWSVSNFCSTPEQPSQSQQRQSKKKLFDFGSSADR